MRQIPRRSGWVVVLILVFVQPVSAQRWSPDGNWVAYTVDLRTSSNDAGSGLDWLVDHASTGRIKQATTRESKSVLARIWTTKPLSGESVLLEENQGPLTLPAWNPDGSAIAFGRVVTDSGPVDRFEVVVQDAPDHKRVLQSWPIERPASPSLGRFASDVAWSPDGRHLVVPRIHPSGLVLLRVEDGRIVKTLDGASRPSWSPDGLRIAFYLEGKEPSLSYLDVRSGEPHRLVEVPASDPCPAPCWSKDGQTVLFVARHASAPRPGRPSFELKSGRVRVESGQTDYSRDLVHEPISETGPLLNVAFSQDREGEVSFHSTTVAGQTSQLTLSRSLDGVVLKRFNPFDERVPISRVEASPAPEARLLCVWFGEPGQCRPPAVTDPETENLIPLVPDEDARRSWIALLLSATRTVLDETLPKRTQDGHPLARPTRLPLVGEMDDNNPGTSRLRKLCGIARELRGRGANADGPPENAFLLEDARLVVAYLSENYQEALTALDLVEKRANDPDDRLRLLGLRAQIQMGLKEDDRAGAMVGYLRSIFSHPPQRIEETPFGAVLSAVDEPGEDWSLALERQLADRKAGRSMSSPVFPTEIDHTNFDAPQPGLGLDPAQPQVQIVIPPQGVNQPPVVQIPEEGLPIRVRDAIPPPPQPAAPPR